MYTHLKYYLFYRKCICICNTLCYLKSVRENQTEDGEFAVKILEISRVMVAMDKTFI